MDNKKLKNLLRETMEIEDELYDFCIECLKKIYGEDSQFAINAFEEGYNARDWNGCIQSFNSVDTQTQERIKFVSERKKGLS